MSKSALPPWTLGAVPRDRKPKPLSKADLLVRRRTREHLAAILGQIQTAFVEMECLEDCPEDWQAYVMAIMIEDINDTRLSLIALLEAEKDRLLGLAGN